MGAERFRRAIIAGIAIVFLFGCFSLNAQSLGSEKSSGEESDLKGPSAVSAVFPLLSNSLGFLPLIDPPSAAIVPWIANPLLIGTHIPLYWIDSGRALGYSIAGLALPAAGIGLMFTVPVAPIAQPISSTLLNGYAHLMEYSAYDTYRLAAKDPARYSLSELAVAPFRWDNIRSPLVWIPSVVAPAALVGFYLAFEPDLGKPVYETGQSSIGPARTSPLVGGLSAAGFGFADMLATAVGEESYYRGVVYNEAKLALGMWPARAVDMVLFPLLHLPSDITAGLKTGTVLFNFGWRSAMTLIFDMASDRGGLPLAVTTHFWSDFVLIMARWVFYRG